MYKLTISNTVRKLLHIFIIVEYRTNDLLNPRTKIIYKALKLITERI